jgi:hypothetical protein
LIAGLRGLLFFRFNRHRLQIFGFEDLPAVDALDVIHTIATRDDRRVLVLTGGRHT